ncbi:metal ABC transporter substrate-binding protein [Schaalia sp. lx-100]|uniref:metal ABC transporter substrate-binding protein n=1 Tax=Schaalia sp. lx-100 TaxID=2899081 RepID=UPI001E39C659|nr:metal ABC transporter substrate-binding protein [Schaalia sp. lx-100]
MRTFSRIRATVVSTISIAALFLAACSSINTAPSGTQSATPTGDKPTVATTFTVLADIARNVAGEYLDIVSITKEGAEIHGYEPTPGDIAKASKARLVIDNGLGLELWFEKFIAEAAVPHIVASQGVPSIPIAEDAAQGHDNPHAWMSPTHVKTYVDNMARAFADIDPEHAQAYRNNAETYKTKLDKVRTDLIDTLSVLPENQRALVTCEGAFSYLAKDAGLTEKYLWAVNAENQATPGQIASAIEFVKEHNIPAVFCESTVSDAPMQQVVDATDAQFGGVLYVDSLSDKNGPVPTYLDLITHDAQLIAHALTGAKN